VIGVLEGVMKWRDMRQARTEEQAFKKSLTPEETRKIMMKKSGLAPDNYTLGPNQKRFSGDEEIASNVVGQKPREIMVSNGKRKVKITEDKFPEWKAKGYEKGLPLDTKQTKPEMTPTEAKKEISRIEALKTKMKTTKGLDPMSLAMMSQTMPQLAEAIRGQDVSTAIKIMEQYQNDLARDFITGPDRANYQITPSVNLVEQADNALKQWQLKGQQVRKGVLP